MNPFFNVTRKKRGKQMMSETEPKEGGPTKFRFSSNRDDGGAGGK